MAQSIRKLKHFSPLLLLLGATNARIGQKTRRIEAELKICASSCADALHQFDGSFPCSALDAADLQDGLIECIADCDESCAGECIDPLACLNDDEVDKMAEGLGLQGEDAVLGDYFDDDDDAQYDDEEPFDDDDDLEYDDDEPFDDIGGDVTGDDYDDVTGDDYDDVTGDDYANDDDGIFQEDDDGEVWQDDDPAFSGGDVDDVTPDGGDSQPGVSIVHPLDAQIIGLTDDAVINDDEVLA
jgi:hypothetical protein